MLIIPHKRHIDELIKAHNAGSSVIVWYQSGTDWAEDVIKALEIKEFVNCYMTKPTHLYDDLDYSAWLLKRLCLSLQ